MNQTLLSNAYSNKQSKKGENKKKTFSSEILQQEDYYFFSLSSSRNLKLEALQIEGYLKQFGDDIRCSILQEGSTNNRFKISCRRSESCLNLMLFEHSIDDISFLLVPKSKFNGPSIFKIKKMAAKKKKRTLKVKQVPKNLKEQEFSDLFEDLGTIEGHHRLLDKEEQTTNTLFVFYEDKESIEEFKPKGNGIIMGKGYCLPVFILKPPRYLQVLRTPNSKKQKIPGCKEHHGNNRSKNISNFISNSIKKSDPSDQSFYQDYNTGTNLPQIYETLFLEEMLDSSLGFQMANNFGILNKSVYNPEMQNSFCLNQCSSDSFYTSETGLSLRDRQNALVKNQNTKVPYQPQKQGSPSFNTPNMSSYSTPLKDANSYQIQNNQFQPSPLFTENSPYPHIDQSHHGKYQTFDQNNTPENLDFSNIQQQNYFGNSPDSRFRTSDNQNWMLPSRGQPHQQERNYYQARRKLAHFEWNSVQRESLWNLIGSETRDINLRHQNLDNICFNLGQNNYTQVNSSLNRRRIR